MPIRFFLLSGDKGQQSVPFQTKTEVLVSGLSPEQCVWVGAREIRVRTGSFLSKLIMQLLWTRSEKRKGRAPGWWIHILVF